MGRFALALSTRDAVFVAQRLRALDRAEADATCGALSDEERGQRLAAGVGTVFTVWSDDEPVAMGGWLPLWPGVASAWMLATDRLLEAGVALDRAAIIGHERMFADGYHRLQVFSLASRTDSRAWLINLGYIPEGTHPCFGRHGETFLSYAKLRKDS